MPDAGAPRVLGVSWIPLEKAVLCIEEDCEVVYSIDEAACPRCASKKWMLFEKFMQERRSAALHDGPEGA